MWLEGFSIILSTIKSRPMPQNGNILLTIWFNRAPTPYEISNLHRNNACFVLSQCLSRPLIVSGHAYNAWDLWCLKYLIKCWIFKARVLYKWELIVLSRLFCPNHYFTVKYGYLPCTLFKKKARVITVWRKYTRFARLTQNVRISQASSMEGKYSQKATYNRRSHCDIYQYIIRIYGHKRYFPSDKPKKELRFMYFSVQWSVVGCQAYWAMYQPPDIPRNTKSEYWW